MATATAKRGKGTKPRKPPEKPPAAAKKRARKKNGHGSPPPAQNTVLARELATDPLLTSEQFAAKFNLPVDEVARHRFFILQYVFDYDVKNAAMRCGYPEITARETGLLMLNYSFSQLFLSEVQKAATAETVVTQGQILSALWREANAPDVAFSSNSSTRIAALSQLAKITGLTGPKPKGPDSGIRKIMFVGNVALVNAAASPDQWGARAIESQGALRESVTIDV